MILRGRSPEEAIANLEDLRKQVPDYLLMHSLHVSIILLMFLTALKAEQYFNKVSDLS